MSFADLASHPFGPAAPERANVRSPRSEASRSAVPNTRTASEFFMGHGSPNEGTLVPKNGTGVTAPTSLTGSLGERVATFLGALHPVKTAENAAAELRVPSATIRKLLQRRSTPSGDLLARMIAVWGPEFASAALPGCAWLSEAAAARRRVSIDARIAALTEQRNAILGRLRSGDS